MTFPVALSMTFPENWPDQLINLAPRMHGIELSSDDMMAIGGFTPAFRESMEYDATVPLSDDLMAAIDAAMLRFPTGVMPRLGYCSWKGSTVQHAQCFGTRGVMAVICQPDPRIASALEIHLRGDTPAVLHLREWQDIQPAFEFRMFVQGGRNVGVSQYNHEQQFSELARLRREIEHAIAEFETYLLPGLHLQDVIVDFYLTPNGQARLIELNPLSRRADACLFSWDDPDGFDGRLHLSSDAAQPA